MKEDDDLPGFSKEGLVDIIAEATGTEKGPGSKGPVFYNPAMVQNRDLSVVMLQALIDSDSFKGTGPMEILDGLTGSGIRSVRFAKEVDPGERGMAVEGVDLKEGSVDSARELAFKNGADVEFHTGDLNSFYGNRRFDYIDIDPFGSPVPFIQNAILSLKRNGVLAVTATDTAALTGSVGRVARRRYGIETGRTHFMQELGARSLLGYVTRIASTFERSVEPLFFYTRDHFIRGYVRIGKGAKRADGSLQNLGWFDYEYPRSPIILKKLSSIEGSRNGRKIIGPIWTGSLSDEDAVRGCLDVLVKGGFDHLKTKGSIEKMLTLSLSEDELPPGGLDINETASLLSMSPPSVKTISAGIEGSGYRWSRSRFSPTQIRTDAPFDVIERIFKEAL